MSTFRDRHAARPSQLAESEADRARRYRRVFSSDDGRRVLDDIVQRICGVDAVVQIPTSAPADAILTQRNIGLLIARLALGEEEKDQTVEVKT